MAREVLTKIAVLGPYPTLQPPANSLDVAFTAANVADKNQFAPSGNDVLLVWNTDVANPYTFTLTSFADEKKRTGDITAYTLQAGDHVAFKLNQIAGWAQADGQIYLEANNAAIKFAVLQL